MSRIEKQLYDQLFSCCKNNDAKALEILLNIFPDININRTNEEGDTPLIMSIRNKNIDVISILVKNKNIDINKVNERGYNALIVACIYNRILTVSILLSHPKIDVNIVDKDGDTPLTYSCDSGKKEIVEMLLKHKDIDINIVNRYNHDALYYAKYNKNTEIVEMLEKYINSKTRKEIIDNEEIEMIQEKSNQLLQLLKSNEIDISKIPDINRSDMSKQEANTILRILQLKVDSLCGHQRRLSIENDIKQDNTNYLSYSKIMFYIIIIAALIIIYAEIKIHY